MDGGWWQWVYVLLGRRTVCYFRFIKGRGERNIVTQVEPVHAEISNKKMKWPIVKIFTHFSSVSPTFWIRNNHLVAKVQPSLNLSEFTEKEKRRRKRRRGRGALGRVEEEGKGDEGEGLESSSYLRTQVIVAMCPGNFPPCDQFICVASTFIQGKRVSLSQAHIEWMIFS